MMYGYSAGFGGGFGGGLWMLGGLLLAVGVIVLVVWLVAPRTHLAVAPARDASPLDILRERYARGEISEEEFERRRKVLGA